MFYWSALGHCRIQKDSNFALTKTTFYLLGNQGQFQLTKCFTHKIENQLAKIIYFLFVVSSQNSKLERLSMIAQKQRFSTYLLTTKMASSYQLCSNFGHFYRYRVKNQTHPSSCTTCILYLVTKYSKIFWPRMNSSVQTWDKIADWHSQICNRNLCKMHHFQGKIFFILSKYVTKQEPKYFANLDSTFNCTFYILEVKVSTA